MRFETPPAVELTVESAPDYVRRFTGTSGVRVTPLAGGVSNTVLLVESGEARLVVKQSLPQLRVEEEWLCDRSRILRESAAMQLLSPLLAAGSVPAVVFEDPDNFVFAMQAAPANAETWKASLMRGEINQLAAASAGALLAAIARDTSQNNAAKRSFSDLEAFRQLRLDPYYRHTAARHPDLAPFFAALIEECENRRLCLVHGDFSPKNFLVTSDGLMVIDWECVHYGNPAFDAAFALNHLLLKSFWLPRELSGFRALAQTFWRALAAELRQYEWFEQSTMRHWAGLLLARVDGKSPVEYIRDPEQRAQVRRLALDLIRAPARSVDDVFERRSRQV